MPIYEYHCSKCGDFEAMQKMSDKPLTQCPACRRKVTKLISSTTFHLKGSGWYITDYARKGDSGGVKADKSESKSTSTDTTSTSDAGSSDTAKPPEKSSDKSSGKKSKKAAVA
jgi:putative FmdB family regulatory protein